MKRAEAGHALILVLVVTFLVFSALVVCWFVISSETHDTVHLVKEIQATAIGEGVAAHLVSMVNRTPWEARFYRRDGTDSTGSPGTLASLPFTHDTFPFAYGDPEYAEGKVSFVGVIRDVDPEGRVYRIYVEVQYYGYRVVLSWDKRYEEGLLGALNRDATMTTKSVGAVRILDVQAPVTALDRIRTQALDTADAGGGQTDDISIRELERYLDGLDEFAEEPERAEVLVDGEPLGDADPPTATPLVPRDAPTLGIAMETPLDQLYKKVSPLQVQSADGGPVTDPQSPLGSRGVVGTLVERQRQEMIRTTLGRDGAPTSLGGATLVAPRGTAAEPTVDEYLGTIGTAPTPSEPAPMEEPTAAFKSIGDLVEEDRAKRGLLTPTPSAAPASMTEPTDYAKPSVSPADYDLQQR